MDSRHQCTWTSISHEEHARCNSGRTSATSSQNCSFWHGFLHQDFHPGFPRVCETLEIPGLSTNIQLGFFPVKSGAYNPKPARFIRTPPQQWLTINSMDSFWLEFWGSEFQRYWSSMKQLKTASDMQEFHVWFVWNIWKTDFWFYSQLFSRGVWCINTIWFHSRTELFNCIGSKSRSGPLPDVIAPYFFDWPLIL